MSNDPRMDALFEAAKAKAIPQGLCLKILTHYGPQGNHAAWDHVCVAVYPRLGQRDDAIYRARLHGSRVWIVGTGEVTWAAERGITTVENRGRRFDLQGRVEVVSYDDPNGPEQGPMPEGIGI